METETSNCENHFVDKDIISWVKVFNETLMNIFSNFTPDKINVFTDNDIPWKNDINDKVKLKSKFYHC